MPRMKSKETVRKVKAIHASKSIKPDAASEIALAQTLKKDLSAEGLLSLYARYAGGLTEFDLVMRRVLLRVWTRSFGNGVRVMEYVGFKHPETFSIGSGVFIGAQSYLQGRYDGRFIVGNRVWIGPQSYFDARNLILEDEVGWGPGAKVLGSQHSGEPWNIPVIRTDLKIKPVRVLRGADIGVNAVLLPGVTVGEGCIVGAGAVVTKDLPDYAVAAGVPAQIIRSRKPERKRR